MSTPKRPAKKTSSKKSKAKVKDLAPKKKVKGGAGHALYQDIFIPANRH